MGYEDFNEVDFALDNFFCQWVLKPDIRADAFWMEWLRIHTERSREIQQARKLVLVASMDIATMDIAVVNIEILSKIHQRKLLINYGTGLFSEPKLSHV